MARMKTDGKRGREILRGTLGDKIQAPCCDPGHNIRLPLKGLRNELLRLSAELLLAL